MRVLQVAPHMDVGGAERTVIALSCELVARGHEVALFAPAGHLERGLPREVRRVVVGDLRRSPVASAAAAARLARTVRAERPALVHAHNPKMTAVAAVALRAAGARRPPLLATFQAVAATDRRRAAWLLRRADAVVAVSDDLARDLQADGCHGVEVIGNCVAVPPALPEHERAALDAELGVDGAPLVLAVGRLVPQKNHERLLAAARLLADARPDVQVRIAGDGVLRAELERRAQELGLAGRVRFLGTRDDVPALLACADLLLVSSDFEGHSVAVLEALAAGTPVVTTPVAGMRALLGDGAGIVADRFAPAPLAAAALELLADDDRRRAMGEAARAVAARHSAAAMADAYEDRYRRLLAASPR